MINKVLVLGDGFLGNAFKRRGYDVWGRREIEYPDNLDSFECLPSIGKYDAVVNTIGISDTRFCEDDANWDMIHGINGILPAYLSKTCAMHGVKFCHISTGCLYDTRDIPQKETNFKSAHCNYVISKWVGEIGCDLENDLVIRPRLLFDSVMPKKNTRNNLICKMEKFDSFLKELNSVTSNDTIVESVEALLEHDQSVVFNVANTGNYTIADMARHLGFDVKKELTQEELHESQGLYLVNNIMNTSKLEEFYQPRDTLVELARCYSILKEKYHESAS